MIYTLDSSDDWKLEENWVKANPSWNILYKEGFKNDAKRAIRYAASERPFKNFRLNIWTDVREAWMGEMEWNSCAVDPPKEDHELVELSCWAGADFAETRDLCALVLNFKLPDSRTYAKFFFWIPEKKVQEKEDIVNYHVWRSAGFVNVIGGDAINHEDLAVEVAGILKKCGPLRPKAPRSIDPFRALARAIIYQQLSGKAASTILKRLAALYAPKPFPLPEDILRTSEARFRSAGVSRQKAGYLHDLAEKAPSDGEMLFQILDF